MPAPEILLHKFSFMSDNVRVLVFLRKISAFSQRFKKEQRLNGLKITIGSRLEAE